MTLSTPKYDEEIELKVNTEQYRYDRRNLSESQSNDIEDNNEKIIFKYNKYDAIIFCILFIFGVLGIIPIIIMNHSIYYALIASIGYITSIIMAISLNSDDIPIKKRVITLFVSYFIVLLSLFVTSISNKQQVNISKYITITSLLCSWIIIFIMFWYEFAKQAQAKTVIKYLWSVKALIIPVFAQFADIATDIGASYLYYQQSQENNSEIDYNGIFITSIGILLFYRIISAAIIGYYTHNITDAILQFFDLYLIKTLNIEWKLKYKEPGRVHQFIESLESIFESGPQAIISLYIIIADNNTSVLIWISSISSILSIALKSTSQDKRFFTPESHSKEIGFNIDNGCQCNIKSHRCLFCNYSYLIRVSWRLIDVTSFILLCALYWDWGGGANVFFYLGLHLAAILCAIWSFWRKGGELQIYWLNGLLSISPSSWSSACRKGVIGTETDGIPVTLGMIRITISIILIYGIFEDSSNEHQHEITIINAFLFIVALLLYIYFVGRRGLANNCNGCSVFGDNWVNEGVVTTLSIAGCDDMQEIKCLRDEGVEITQYFKKKGTWCLYPRPVEIVKIVKELNYDLSDSEINYFIEIAHNERLDENMSTQQIKSVIGYLKQFSDINQRYRMYTAIEYAYQYHQNTLWIKAFMEEGADFDVEKCIEKAAKNRFSKDRMMELLKTFTN